jgi:nitrate reductase gamma subunit
MLDVFFFVALPYLALTVMVAGSLYRYHSNRFSYSSLSSQMLESKRLRWGSVPWHVGILVLLIGHLVPMLVPGLWQSLTANYLFLIAVEALGLVAAFIALFGLVVLLFRRLTSGRVQAVTTPADLLVLGLLLVQVLLGIAVATGFRWGAQWSTSTIAPYLWSLFTLQPNIDYIAGLPPTVKVHFILAWFIFLLVPFTRLVHIFSIPLAYLGRPFIRVVWANPRRFDAAPKAVREALESRRYFLQGALGVGGASVLLGVGVMDKVGRFFRGPELTPDEEAKLLTKRRERLEMNADQRELELERIRKDYIHVAQMAELKPRDGKYFIDYEMRPALAFRGESGLPVLISAKCTHLGCTVGSSLDNSGRLLCPCHVSYFDLETGTPNSGSPAKAPLPHLGWVLMNPAGEIVMSQGAGGVVQGDLAPLDIESCGVYIAKQFQETV